MLRNRFLTGEPQYLRGIIAIIVMVAIIIAKGK